jgi:hypothetical protein
MKKEIEIKGFALINKNGNFVLHNAQLPIYYLKKSALECCFEKEKVVMLSGWVYAYDIIDRRHLGNKRKLK